VVGRTLAQTPFDTGFTAMQTLFTGTVAKVASLIAIVVGGYRLASAFASITADFCDAAS
jgi:type IV secretory pathway VirB2 component (pilin)